jgi:hypothetical protein
VFNARLANEVVNHRSERVEFSSTFEADLADDADAFQPTFSWSPAGQTLLYSSMTPTGVEDLSLLQLAGGASSQVSVGGLPGKKGILLGPEWSADSRYVLVVPDDGNRSLELIDVAKAERVASLDTGLKNAGAVFAAKGPYFTYSLLKADDTRERGYAQATPDGVVDKTVLPSGTYPPLFLTLDSLFSRDGRTLVYAVRESAEHYTLHRVIPPGVPELIPVDVPGEPVEIAMLDASGSGVLARVQPLEPGARATYRWLYADSGRPSVPVSDPERNARWEETSADNALALFAYGPSELLAGDESYELVDLSTHARVPVPMVPGTERITFWGRHVVQVVPTATGTETHVRGISGGQIVDAVVGDLGENPLWCTSDLGAPTMAGPPVRIDEVIPDKLVLRGWEELALMSLAGPVAERVGTLRPSQQDSYLGCPVWTRKGDAFVYVEQFPSGGGARSSLWSGPAAEYPVLRGSSMSRIGRSKCGLSCGSKRPVEMAFTVRS